MKRVPILAVLLAGAGFFGLGACSGPTAPPGDAGFGSTTSTGGITGTGGNPWGPGPSNGWGVGGTSGTGGYGGSTQPRSDGGEEEPRDGGRRPRDPVTSPDAGGPAAICPAGASSGAMCPTPGLTCQVPAGDGGEGDVCSCRMRGGRGVWRCEGN